MTINELPTKQRGAIGAPLFHLFLHLVFLWLLHLFLFILTFGHIIYVSYLNLAPHRF